MFANSVSVGLAYVDARLQPAVFCTRARISAILITSASLPHRNDRHNTWLCSSDLERHIINTEVDRQPLAE